MALNRCPAVAHTLACGSLPLAYGPWALESINVATWSVASNPWNVTPNPWPVVLNRCPAVAHTLACGLSPLAYLQVINTRAREGGLKEHSAKQKWPREIHRHSSVA